MLLRILTYHRIADPAATPLLHPRLVSATPWTFERHLDHLARHYEVVAMPDVVDAVHGGRRLPKRAVLLTFDDAYRDFLDAAWPLLRARGLPATMFVPTAYLDRPGAAFWWDRLHRCIATTPLQEFEVRELGVLPLRTPQERRAGLARLQAHLKTIPHAAAMTRLEEWAAQLSEPPFEARSFLSWDELRTLASAGLSLGAHTRNHPLLPGLAAADLEAEIAGSLADLRRELGSTLPVFCYPSGAHDDASVAAVRAAGVELAFTQMDGHNDLRVCDPLRLRRTNITRRTSPRLLPLRLQTWFTVVDRWRHRQRPAPGKPVMATGLQAEGQ